MISEDEVGHFTRDCIPKLKALVKKRWAEGRPICIEDPQEYMIPWFVEKIGPIIAEEWKKQND